jgi:hypothetical protein
MEWNGENAVFVLVVVVVASLVGSLPSYFPISLLMNLQMLCEVVSPAKRLVAAIERACMSCG